MNYLNQLLIIGQTGIAITILLLCKDKDININTIKITLACTNIIILYSQISQFNENSLLLTIAITTFFIFYLNYKSINIQQQIKQEPTFQININDEKFSQDGLVQSERDIKSESKASFQIDPQQTSRPPQMDELPQKSNLSFLGEFKQSQLSKGTQQTSQYRNSLLRNEQIENLNLVKYKEGGEVKLGIMATLKSIRYDHKGAELDPKQVNYSIGKKLTKLISEIEKSDQPNQNIEILYESDEQKSGHFPATTLQQKIEMPLKTEQSIFGPQQQQKNLTITWYKIGKESLLMFIIGLGWMMNIDYQYTFLLALLIRNVMVGLKVQKQGLELICGIRELLAWTIIFFSPAIGMFFCSPQLNLIVLIVLCQYQKVTSKYPLYFSILYILLGIMVVLL